MQTIRMFWESLGRISRFSYRSCPGPDSLTGWQGEGAGTVQLSFGPDREWIHFTEQCQFRLEQTGQCFELKNQFRWTWSGGDSIRLEQWRRAHPVHLLDLVPVDATRLVERQTHHCGADDYRLEIRLCDGGFDADWVIRGPKKDELLAYSYR